jgi:hypothetical protein
VIQGRQYQFGVSGALYKRNLLLYDRQTESLWSQLLSEAVSGPLAGTRLSVLPAENTTWGGWKTAHPRTVAFSFATGYRRDYRLDPYASYPLSRHPALLVSVEGVIKIYPFSELKKASSPIVDQLNGRAVTIVFNKDSETARVVSPEPAITWFVGFVHDLKAVYGEVQVYRAARK